MLKYTLKIDGMMCGMCEAHINEAVHAAFKVKKVSSSHTKGETVIITESPRDKKKLAEGAEAIAAELKECADMIEEIDLKMQDIRDRIAMLKLKEKDSAASGSEK